MLGVVTLGFVPKNNSKSNFFPTAFNLTLLSGLKDHSQSDFVKFFVSLLLLALFPLIAKKMRICEIMSGGFAVKIQQCVKKSGGFW